MHPVKRRRALVETNASRDNRCNSSRTMGQGATRSRLSVLQHCNGRSDQREAQTVALFNDMQNLNIGPIDCACLKKLIQKRRREAASLLGCDIVLPHPGLPGSTRLLSLPLMGSI